MILLTLLLACPAPADPEPIPETGQVPPTENEAADDEA